MRSVMSAIGTKRTWASALHMSAFGVTADMTYRRRTSAFGVTADMTYCGAHVRFWHKADIWSAPEDQACLPSRSGRAFVLL